MEHITTVNALLITQAEADSGVGCFSILKDEDGGYSIVDGSGMNHGEDRGLTEALEDAEMLAMRFDVARLTKGGLSIEDAQEIEHKMGDMIAPVLHYGPTSKGPIFTNAEAEAYIQRRLDPPEAVVLTMSSREYDAMLAGLRLLATSIQNRLVLPDDDDIGAILTNGQTHPGLSYDQIQDLADAINTGERDPR